MSPHEQLPPGSRQASPYELMVPASLSPAPEAFSSDGLRRRSSRPGGGSAFSSISESGGLRTAAWGYKERGPYAPGRHTRALTNDDLQEAVLRGDLRLVRELCLAGASVNAPLRPLCDVQYMSVLHILAGKPTIPHAGELIVYTIRQRADVDARSSYGSTPLIFACWHKHVAAAEALLAHGADRDAIDDYGRNALHAAVSLERRMPGIDVQAASVQLVNVLHKFGADPSYGGNTPAVTEGVLQGNDDAVTRLLELGAKAQGLHEAVNQSHIGIIKRLVEHEANPFLRDSKGMDVMEIAIARGDLEISNLIRDFMGKLEREKHPHLHTRKNVEREESLERQKASKKDGIVEPLAGPTPLRRFFLRLGHECRKVGRNGIFQKIMIAALVVALFLPDMCVIFLIANVTVLDMSIIVIFVCFAVEYFVLVFGSWNSYVGSFYFWMDLLGMISVPLDHSLVQATLMPDHKGMDNSMLVRTTRMIRLATRAGRFTKLVKLLRFLPGMGEKSGDGGAAQGVSSRINGKISILVSCLIIVMIMLLPVFDLFRYPTDDLSMRVWVETLNDAVQNHEESLDYFMSDVETFYWDMDYFPLTFEAQFPNGTMFQRSMEAKVMRAPARADDYLEFSTGSVTMVFNFETPNRAESIRNCVLIVSILVFMVGAASNVSKEVSTIVLKPLDELLGVVKKIARNIFSSVLQMTNSLSIMAAQDDESAAESEEEEEDVFRQETLLLQIILKKLTAMSMFLMADDPMSDDTYAKLGDKDREMLECLTTAGTTVTVEEYITPAINWEVSRAAAEQLLANKGMSVADIETWAMNVMDLTMEQTRTMALGIIVIDGDRVPPDPNAEPDDAELVCSDAGDDNDSYWDNGGDDHPAAHGEGSAGAKGDRSPGQRSRADSAILFQEQLDMVVIPAAPPPPDRDSIDFGGGVRLDSDTPLSAYCRTETRSPHTVISCAEDDPWQGSLSAFKYFIFDVLAEYPATDRTPYHNWRHGIDVMFTAHRVLSMCSASEWMTTNERFAVSVGALAHDVAYPGFNNIFLVETSHEIALRYNDHSPNEYMHAAKLFEIANRPQRQIFAELSQEDYRLVRSYCVEAILHTDNLKHFNLLAEMQMLYESEKGAWDRSYKYHDLGRELFPSPDLLEYLREPAPRAYIRTSLLHFCDISNPMKPWALCWVWAGLCIEEFFLQGDREKQLGIPVQPLNDRETLNLPYSQIGFIEFFVAPFVSLTAKILPPLASCEVFLFNNLDTWVEEWISKASPGEEELQRVSQRVQKIKRGGAPRVGISSLESPLGEES